MKESLGEVADPPRYQVGRRLRELRIERGLSQRELARRAEMTNANLSMIEQGRVSPSIQTLEKILRAIPISLTDFFRDDAPLEARVSKRSAQAHILSEAHEAFICLSPRAEGPSLFVIYQHVKPGFALTEIPVVSRAGWLSVVVIHGTISLTLEDRSWTLECGDAFQFHQHRRFRLENLTDQEVTLILTISSIDSDIDNKV